MPLKSFRAYTYRSTALPLAVGAWTCVRNWDFVRKRDRIGKHVITGRVQDREVVAIIISDLLVQI